MKLDIKKDMYIRTKDGIIDKVIFDYNGHCAGRNCDCKHISCVQKYYEEDAVIKASFDIIDLVEKGDYVNGCKVYKKGNCLTIILDDEENIGWINPDDIKLIVTKEQFEQMSYKVGD